MAIKAGPYKGHMIEPGQVRLANILTLPTILGKPQILTSATMDAGLKDKQGVIAFMRIPGYIIDGALSGHIDLVRHGKFLWFFETLDCVEQCYWNSMEYWFWPLA
jgi:hypothetical protein